MSERKHTLEDVRAEYDRLDKLCGVDTKGIKLKISKRATRQFGYCHYVTVAGRLVPDSISITDFILDCETQFWDTIRHEYAHALVAIRTGKPHHHDNVWKAACLEVGCSPNCQAHDDEAHNKTYEKKAERFRYKVTCKSCGRISYFVKKGAVVKALEAGRKCTCCCGGKSFALESIKKEKKQ